MMHTPLSISCHRYDEGVPAHAYGPQPLEPGDRLMFLTDGMLERNADSIDVAAVVAGGGECTRGKPCRTVSGSSSTRRVASSTTTRPPCASTGMAALHKKGRRTRARTTEAVGSLAHGDRGSDGPLLDGGLAPILHQAGERKGGLGGGRAGRRRAAGGSAGAWAYRRRGRPSRGPTRPAEGFRRAFAGARGMILQAGADWAAITMDYPRHATRGRAIRLGPP
jgi:hypothetical protein